MKVIILMTLKGVFIVNNKGFTLIELLVTLAFTSFIVYSVISMPTQLIRDYYEYKTLIQETGDLNKIRTALSNDLENGVVNQLDNNIIQVGNKRYIFNEDGLYRDNVKVTEEELFYEISDGCLIVYNDNIRLIYNFNNLTLHSSNGGIN